MSIEKGDHFMVEMKEEFSNDSLEHLGAENINAELASTDLRVLYGRILRAECVDEIGDVCLVKMIESYDERPPIPLILKYYNTIPVNKAMATVCETYYAKNKKPSVLSIDTEDLPEDLDLDFEETPKGGLDE